MVHLQSYATEEYKFIARNMPNYLTPYRNAYFLKKEATAVVNKSVVNGNDPVRYILVQSDFNNYRYARRTQVVGVSCDDNTFAFYIQESDFSNNIEVIKPPWQEWRWYKRYQNATS